MKPLGQLLRGFVLQQRTRERRHGHMAITKLKEIRNTLDKAILYICNPEKTKGMLLVDSSRCYPETAAAQMELTASFGTGMGNRKAYHLIQSFDPNDDITPEKALEIGKQYADLVTGGRFEYVIATHNDGKHIHNHIIFNAVSFEDYRKYHHGKEDVQRIMDLSDRLCRENHLSVIESTSGRKGRDHEECRSGSPWREHLADLIDTAILESQSFEEFLENLEMEGVTVKQGKHLSFKCELLGQERSCRGKTIGPGYTEEAIRARIERDEKFLSENRLKSPEEMRTWKERRKKEKSISTKIEESKKINKLIDTKDSMAAGKSMAYVNKLQKVNIDNFVKFTNFMQEHGLFEAEDLIAYERDQKVQIMTLQENLDARIQQRKIQQIKYENVRDYFQYKRSYLEYKKGGSQADYRNQHQKEIEGYLKAEAYLKSIGITKPAGRMLKEILENELTPLNQKITQLRQTINLHKQDLQKTATIRQIYEQTYGVKLEIDDINSLQSAKDSAADKSKDQEDILH